MARLHVNVDHVATLRQARRGVSPDPVAWALACEASGARGITIHLRKDRRHIQDADVKELRERLDSLLNLECSLDPEMLAIAEQSGAEAFCLVPENRQEITTEGGLDVLGERTRLAEAVPRLVAAGGIVSLFVDPDPDQLAAAADTGAPYVELHTGSYANAHGEEREAELERLVTGARLALDLGLRVNAGHGLDYANTASMLHLPGLEEVNIGHAIVCRAVTVGVTAAVSEMVAILDAVEAGA